MYSAGSGRVLWSALVNVVMNFWVLAPPGYLDISLLLLLRWGETLSLCGYVAAKGTFVITLNILAVTKHSFPSYRKQYMS
jgi:hypothetical protein